MTEDTRPGAQETIPQGTQTLAKGLQIISAIARGSTTLKAVVESTGTGRSSAHRMIQLLVHMGYLRHGRSEEHTSELQSRFDLVCRLLLEKKKKKQRG